MTANCLHPGYVNTGIFQVEGVRGWLLRRLADALAIPPARGAETSIYLATSPEVQNTTPVLKTPHQCRRSRLPWRLRLVPTEAASLPERKSTRHLATKAQNRKAAGLRLYRKLTWMKLARLRSRWSSGLSDLTLA